MSSSMGVSSGVREAFVQSKINVTMDETANESSAVATLAVHRPAEFFSSPHGKIKPESGVFVIQFRDASTGEVLLQYPSEKVVAEYQRTASISEAVTTSPPSDSSPVPQQHQTAVAATPAPPAAVEEKPAKKE